MGKFGYQIEGVEGAGNIYAFADTTYSNYVEVIQKPLVYVPNAFSPNDNGLNDLFSPSIGFIDIVDYRFTIFDRWGEVMFQTSDSEQGWNGRYNEHKCEPGVYVWVMTFKSASGQYIDRKGVVTLLR
jgi:gliding motility-associated-like protein